MYVKFNLSDEDYARLKVQAEEHALSVPMFAKLWILEHLAELPDAKPKRSPGRPAMTQDDRRLRELEQNIKDIYEGLRTGIWKDHQDEYAAHYGSQMERLDKLLIAKDLSGLELFFKERPWVL